jgi:cell division protein FtsZ
VNLIFGNVIDEAMGDEIRITVIATGFDRWDESKAGVRGGRDLGLRDDGGGGFEGDDDDFDVPPFLK